MTNITYCDNHVILETLARTGSDQVFLVRVSPGAFTLTGEYLSTAIPGSVALQLQRETIKTLENMKTQLQVYIDYMKYGDTDEG